MLLSSRGVPEPALPSSSLREVGHLRGMKLRWGKLTPLRSKIPKLQVKHCIALTRLHPASLPPHHTPRDMQAWWHHTRGWQVEHIAKHCGQMAMPGKRSVHWCPGKGTVLEQGETISRVSCWPIKMPYSLWGSGKAFGGGRLLCDSTGPVCLSPASSVTMFITSLISFSSVK